MAERTDNQALARNQWRFIEDRYEKESAAEDAADTTDEQDE